MVHLAVRKCQDITHFHNFNNTLDSEFFYLKCLVLKSFQEPSTVL